MYNAGDFAFCQLREFRNFCYRQSVPMEIADKCSLGFFYAFGSSFLLAIFKHIFVFIFERHIAHLPVLVDSGSV